MKDDEAVFTPACLAIASVYKRDLVAGGGRAKVTVDIDI
jgi:hypothetical protein